MAKNLWPNKSAFTKPNEVKKLIERSLKNPDRVTDQGTRVVFEKKFNRVIGDDGENYIRIVVSKKTGEIVTAFPQQEFMSSLGLALAISRGQQLNNEIARMRQAHQRASEPGWLEKLIDFFNPIDAGAVANDEAILQEKKLIEDTYQDVLRQSGSNISEDHKKTLLEVLLSQITYTDW